MTVAAKEGHGYRLDLADANFWDRNVKLVTYKKRTSVNTPVKLGFSASICWERRDYNSRGAWGFTR